MKLFSKLAAACVLSIGMIGSAVAEEMVFRISLNTGPNHVRNIALQNFVDTLSARTEGKVMFEGQNIYEMDIDPVEVRRYIGMVFQKPNPFPKSIRKITTRISF